MYEYFATCCMLTIDTCMYSKGNCKCGSFGTKDYHHITSISIKKTLLVVILKHTHKHYKQPRDKTYRRTYYYERHKPRFLHTSGISLYGDEVNGGHHTDIIEGLAAKGR